MDAYAWEQLLEAIRTRAEIDECPRGYNTVRVIAENIRPIRLDLRRLDQAYGEIVSYILPKEYPA